MDDPVIRKHNRLKYRDYSKIGSYFITICARNHHNLFGKIINEDIDSNINTSVQLSKFGLIIDTAINNIPIYYKNAVIKYYIIMPNHIHMIISLIKDSESIMLEQLLPRNESEIFDYVSKVLNNEPDCIMEIKSDIQIANTKSISLIIKKMKEYVTKQTGYSVWHKSFHDHIIRNDNEYILISQYITNNPKNYKKDCYYR